MHTYYNGIYVPSWIRLTGYSVKKDQVERELNITLKPREHGGVQRHEILIRKR